MSFVLLVVWRERGGEKNARRPWEAAAAAQPLSPPLSLNSSAPTRPSIPQARPDRVYDIKYWTRDTRRAGQLVGGTNKLHIEVSSVEVGAPDQALDAAGPAVLGKPHVWTPRSPLLDAPNNGYTT